MGVMVEMVEMVETGRLFQFPGQGLSIDPLNQDFAKIGHPSGSKQTDPQDRFVCISQGPESAC